MKSVAVVTATTGRDTLQQAIDSVENQTYPCHHYVVSDGALIGGPLHRDPNKCFHVGLPKPTGRNGIMNGAVCAMAAYLTTEDYLCFCDDDNWFEPEHIESLVEAMETKNAAYGYSLRKLVHPDGTFYDYDNGESLGHHGDLVDVNCYLMRRDLAIGIAPLWYRTNGSLMIGDRFVWGALVQNNIPWAATGRYTLNYRMSARGQDMKPFHFLKNIMARAKYPDGYPWAA